VNELEQSERGALDDLFKQTKAVGASTATISHGQLVNQEVFGFMNSSVSKSVALHTRFQAASISKTVNAVAILSLVDSDAISLDEPVNKYVTRWQLGGKFADKVTVKHLLSHSGGTTVSGFEGYGPTGPLPGTIEILNGSSTANSPKVVAKSPPGERYNYSGGGTTILQALIEDVTDTQYDDFLSKTIFEPLNMTSSCYSAPKDLKDFSCAHDKKGNPMRGNYMRHPEKAAAGLWTTPKDLAILLIDIFNSMQGSTRSILPLKLSSLMISRVVARSGLGVFLINKNVISHNGNNNGFRSYFVFNVQTGNGVVAMSNSERGARAPAKLIDAIEKQRQWN